MGGFLILGAFLVAQNSTIAGESTAGTIVSSAPDRSYIEEADADNDGVADWQESLAAQIIDSIELPSTTPKTASSEPYTEPTTFTGKFAEAFFTDYLSGKPGGEALAEADRTTLITNAVNSIEANTASKIYSLSDIIIVPDSTEALHAYGNEIAEIITRHSIKNENEAFILKRALEQNDPSVLAALSPIREVYEKVLADSLRVAAPQSVAVSHVALLTSYDAIRTDIGAMEQVFTDPLLTLARIQHYEHDALSLFDTFKALTTTLITMGVSYEKDEPGALIYTLDI